MNSALLNYAAQLAAMTVISIGVATARAELLVYEPFDYAAGASLDGLAATGLNLAGNYVTSTIQDLEIAEPGLTYGSLLNAPSVTGNRLKDVNGAGAGVITAALAEAIPIAPGDAIYFSALMTLYDSDNGNWLANVRLIDGDTGDQISFGEAAVGARAIRVEADTASTGQLISEGMDQAFTDGQTLWLVGRYFNSSTIGGDGLELVGYDTSIAQEVATSFDLADPSAQFAYSLSGVDINLTQITTLQLTIRGNDNNFLDEVRIGTSYAAVVAVPEPATLWTWMLGVGVASVGGMRRLRGA